jgi:hypothetical protein
VFLGPGFRRDDEDEQNSSPVFVLVGRERTEDGVHLQLEALTVEMHRRFLIDRCSWFPALAGMTGRAEGPICHR